MRRGATWRETPLTAPNALEHPRSCADTRLRNRRALQQPPRFPSDPQTSLATSGRFRRPNQPETPQYASVSPGRLSRRRTTPAENRTEVQGPMAKSAPTSCKTAQNPRGGRPQAKPRQPMSMPACSSAQYAHATTQTLAPDAPQTIARKHSWETPAEPCTRPYKSNSHPPLLTRQKVTHTYQKLPY